MKNCIKKITNISMKGLAFCAMMLVAFFGVITAPIMKIVKVFASSENVAAGLKLLKMPNKAKLNKAVAIPFGESDLTGTTVAVKVFDPKGNEVVVGTGSAELVRGSTEYTLIPSKVGSYKVQYTILNSLTEEVGKHEFKIAVTGERATLSFEENSKYIIPSVTNGSYPIVLPNPKVKDSEGEEVTDVLSSLTVSVKDTNSNTTTTLDRTNAEQFKDGHYKFTPNSEADCTYIVTYKYTDTLTGLDTTEVFEVKYEKEFKASDLKLGYKFDGSIPESMELGIEQKLPLVKVYDENDSDLVIDAYTDVEVTFTPNTANKEKYSDLLAEGKDYVIVANSNVFTPVYPSSEGTYKLTYKVSTLYSLSEQKVDKTLVYTVNDVKDSTAPLVYAVGNYSLTDAVSDDFEYVDASYKIPSKVAVNTEVYFPAIYAKDNVTGYNDLKLSRVITPENGSKITLNTRYEETESKYVDAKNNEMVSYKFTEAGTYTINYEALDKAGKYNYTGASYTIVVEEGFTDNVAPRITLNNIPSTVKSGEEISFVDATVVDYKTTNTTETEIVDKNVEVAYYYYTQELSSSELEVELTKARNNETSALTKLLKDKDTEKYIFLAPTSANVKVVCVAYDDNGNMGYETRTITIVDVNDTVIPTIITVDDEYANALAGSGHNQEEQITLPDYIVSDGANTKYLASSVKIVDAKGYQVSAVGAKYTVAGDKLTISNARFIATKAGRYTVTYTINDLGGNYIIKSYFVNVNDTKAPEIVLEGSLSTVEVGELTKLPSFKVTDDSEITSSGIRFIGDNNPSYNFIEGTNEFKALESGIFTYEYYAVDSLGHETISGPYTFEAKDTKKPVITLDTDLNIEKTYPIEKVDNVIQAIVISDFIAEDDLNGIKETKVTVKSPSEKELTVTKTVNGYEFVPTVDGTYTVIYSATDNANNTTEQTFLIKVGDNTAPSIKIENVEANAPTQMKVNNGNLKLELDDITVNDAGSTKKASELVDAYANNGSKMFTVSVVGPNGSTINVVEGKNYEYEITETGKYTITYTARDKAGNEKVVKKYLEVYADDNGSVITTETWSIVLIVASLAVLAGVVIYFIRTRDKKPTKKDIVKLNNDDKK